MLNSIDATFKTSPHDGKSVRFKWTVSFLWFLNMKRSLINCLLWQIEPSDVPLTVMSAGWHWLRSWGLAVDEALRSWRWMMRCRSFRQLWDWRLQRLREQKKHAGVRLNKALSTPASPGTTKGKAAPLNPLWIQTSAQGRRQVNHLKSSDYTVTRIISAVHSSRKWWTPCHFKDILIRQIKACLK